MLCSRSFSITTCLPLNPFSPIGEISSVLHSLLCYYYHYHHRHRHYYYCYYYYYYYYCAYSFIAATRLSCQLVLAAVIICSYAVIVLIHLYYREIIKSYQSLFISIGNLFLLIFASTTPTKCLMYHISLYQFVPHKRTRLLNNVRST